MTDQLLRKHWSSIFFFCGLFSVCAHWWATRAAYGHLRWETTSSSAAPLIAHSRSGTQRRENVSTPSTGIPQQCAACTYMRKGMDQSQHWPFLRCPLWWRAERMRPLSNEFLFWLILYRWCTVFFRILVYMCVCIYSLVPALIFSFFFRP